MPATERARELALIAAQAAADKKAEDIVILDVAARQKDIQFSSRTRAITDQMARQQKYRRLLRDVLSRVPAELRDKDGKRLHAAEPLSLTVERMPNPQNVKNAGGPDLNRDGKVVCHEGPFNLAQQLIRDGVIIDCDKVPVAWWLLGAAAAAGITAGIVANGPASPSR